MSDLRHRLRKRADRLEHLASVSPKVRMNTYLETAYELREAADALLVSPALWEQLLTVIEAVDMDPRYLRPGKIPTYQEYAQEILDILGLQR